MIEDIRPQKFQDFIGHRKIIQQLEVLITSANIRGSALDHILFSGPPGLGKTSLAHLVAKEFGPKIYSISAPAIQNRAEIMGILTQLKKNEFIFIDEIHRMPRNIEEFLYSALEDFRLDILFGQGKSTKVVKIDLPRFTLLGATTRPGDLSRPLRDRFGVSCALNFYSARELGKIILRQCRSIGVRLSEENALTLAKRGRGTPRVALRLLKRLGDYCLAKGIVSPTNSQIQSFFSWLGVDEGGLESMDRRIIEVLGRDYGGGPAGINALSATLNEESGTLQEVYEPFLLHKGLILRTPRGRTLSQEGWQYYEKTKRL